MQTETANDMATKKKAPADLEKSIGIRVTKDERDRLEALALQFPLLNLSLSHVVRAALLVGLDAIEKQPGVLLGEKPKK